MIKKECSIVLFGDCKSPNNSFLTLPLGDRGKKQKPYGQYVNIPWDEISDKKQQGCNMAFTLNADVRVDFDIYGQECVDKCLEVMWGLKCKDILKKIIFVKEYGQNKDGSTKTEETGKLHFHGMCKVTDRQVFEKTLLRTFNKRCQLSHRTLHTKLFRQVEDRSRFYTYLQKEAHNKDTCLMVI